MAHVVFLRGVNVGNARRFQPSALARELAHLGAANLGAAGTFVIRKHLSEAALRSEFAGRLPFTTDLMICRSGELEKLAATDPFPTTGLPPDSRRFVSVLAKKPRRPPPLPFSYPAGENWQVRLVGVSGKLAWGLWRRVGAAHSSTRMASSRSTSGSGPRPATGTPWSVSATCCGVRHRDVTKTG